jgi:hypothetical protein
MKKIEEVIINRVFQSETEYLITVLTIIIPGKKTNDIMKFLCDEFPLQLWEIGHLKRVRKPFDKPECASKGYVEMIICTEEYYNTEIQPLEESVALEEDEKKKKLLQLLTSSEDCIERKIQLVGKYLPESKNEFDLWNKYWPINFHPNELERVRQKTFSEEERTEIHKLSLLLLEERRNNEDKYQLSNFGGFIYNSNNHQIICKTSGVLEEFVIRGVLQKHVSDPLLSTTMICVDEVARIARAEQSGRGKHFFPCLIPASYFRFFRFFSSRLQKIFQMDIIYAPDWIFFFIKNLM